MKLLPCFAIVIVLPLLATALWAGETGKINDATARTSYSLGYQMGQDLKRQGVAFDRRAVIQGLKDGTTGSESLLSREEINAVLAELKRRMVQDIADERQAKSAVLKQAGIDFMESNKAKPGVIDLGQRVAVQSHQAGFRKTAGADRHGSGPLPRHDGGGPTVRFHLQARCTQGV